jgi:hypothetical protein
MDLITQTATPTTLVNGLQADYYEGRNFNTLRHTKLDPTVNLWTSSAPSSSLPADNFSVRWTGQVQPKYSETYTFYTNSDDGIRLWVNGTPLIDNWLPHPATENSNTITLNAGQLYTIQLDYYDLAGNAVAQLMWSSPSQTKEIIPPSQLFSNSPVSANSVLEVAKPANSFINSLGVNTHIRYYDTAYGNYPLIKQRLQELGIQHIRDGGSDPAWIQRMNDLASAGIKSTLVIDPNIGVGPDATYSINPPGYTVTQLVKNLLPNAIDAVEILNEFDVFLTNGYTHKGQAVNTSNWVSYVQDFTRDTYLALKSDPATQGIGIIGPSFVFSDSNSKIGDVSQWVDYGNFHPYNNPSYPGDGNLERDLANRSQSFGTKPMMATETGYFTGSPPTGRAVSEVVQGKYVPRLFLENFNQGVYRTFSYELIDQRPNSLNSEDNFGLLRADGSPKPAFTAQQNLIRLLSDTPVAFTPSSLNYSFGGEVQNIHHTLLQKSNGDFYLALWSEVPSTDQNYTQTVTLNLTTPISQATTYLPNLSTTAIAQYTIPTQLTLTVPDYPLLVQLTPR